jgi:hypothetical protein
MLSRLVVQVFYLKAALHDAITEASQVCKLLATSYLPFVNIYFLKNWRQVKLCVSCQASWVARQVNRELFCFWSHLPSPTMPIYQAQATCLIRDTCKHALTSACVSCGQFIILCRRSFLCVILYYFKMPARWNDEPTCKFVQLYKENECLRNMRTSNISWDFKFSRRRVWCSELSSGMYCRVKCLSTNPWWWRQYAPLKRRSTIILHGSTSQKTILSI